ncbi:MAG: hypothetical protein ACREPX_08580, partial [Rhodanobacteraceae bacterium]
MPLTHTANEVDLQKRAWATWADHGIAFLVAFVPTVSLVAVALLIFGTFTAQRALVIGLPLSIWIARPLLRSAVSSSGWSIRGAAWLGFV